MIDLFNTVPTQEPEGIFSSQFASNVSFPTSLINLWLPWARDVTQPKDRCCGRYPGLWNANLLF